MEAVPDTGASEKITGYRLYPEDALEGLLDVEQWIDFFVILRRFSYSFKFEWLTTKSTLHI